MTESVVAVVGRPNVGKSTLVNRFVGRRAAIIVGLERNRIVGCFVAEEPSELLVHGLAGDQQVPEVVARFVAEVAEYDPPRRVVYRVIEGYKVQTALVVEPDGDGGTRLRTVVTTPRLPGPLDGLVSRLLRRSTTSRARGDLARLTAALQSEYPALGSAG